MNHDSQNQDRAEKARSRRAKEVFLGVLTDTYQYEQVSASCLIHTRRKMIVVVSVSKVNFRFTVDMYTIVAVTELLHDGTQVVILEKAGRAGESRKELELEVRQHEWPRRTRQAIFARVVQLVPK